MKFYPYRTSRLEKFELFPTFSRNPALCCVTRLSLRLDNLYFITTLAGQPIFPSMFALGHFIKNTKITNAVKDERFGKSLAIGIEKVTKSKILNTLLRTLEKNKT